MIFNIYFFSRFWWSLLTLIVLFILGHFFSMVYVIALIGTGVVILLLFIDLLIHAQGHVSAQRIIPEKLSNGDDNPVIITIKNKYPLALRIEVIDELPIQLQKRDFSHVIHMAKYQESDFQYSIKPFLRGVYHFGPINLICQSRIGMIGRRFKAGEKQDIPVYPSFLHLKKTEMIAFMRSQQHLGYKKNNRIGNNKEFEQIKDYIIGDDFRKLNWKATARMNKLMVNEYQDERSQDVYQLIDMGRSMQMPFDGLTLLDHSINTSLALANIILKKNDKTGLLTYSTKVHSFIKSDNRRLQIHRIMETLYAQETSFLESNLEALYHTINKYTTGRSLLIIYTNYESILSLERQLPILKKLSNQHLVLLVSFINTHLVEKAEKPATDLKNTYQKVLAEKNILEKKLFMDQLIRYGIINLRVKPEELNIEVINKYLEIKNRGLL